jgi:hypothetical protein
LENTSSVQSLPRYHNKEEGGGKRGGGGGVEEEEKKKKKKKNKKKKKKKKKGPSGEEYAEAQRGHVAVVLIDRGWVDWLAASLRSSAVVVLRMMVMQFVVAAFGSLSSISYYRDASEPCTGHVGKIFDGVGKEIAR